jgi:hypothetical protein
MPKLKEVTPLVRIGAPIQRQNLSIFPLFAEDVVNAPRYTTVGSALRAGSAKITEVSEGGSVPTLNLENLTDIPVLIIDGEELLGARQNRISNLTVLAPGKQTLKLPVSCVERGRWSYRSREFAESPDIMYREARAKKSRAVSHNLAMSGARVSDQGEVWGDIDALSSKLGFNSPTSAMQDVYQSRRTSIDEYLNDVRVEDGQIGAIFAINGAPAGLELFDSPETLRTYLPKILRSYALDALANQTVTPVKTSDAEVERLLESILELDAKSFPAIGLGNDLRIDSPNITGGALTHEGRVIHLAAFQTSLPESKPGPTGSDDSTRPVVIRKGHILLRGGHGRLALLDTGSPVSIGRGAEYCVAGQVFNPSDAMQSVLDAAGMHIGRRVEWLLGHDFFADNRVVIDWPARKAHILGRNNPQPHGLAIPIDLVMGVPVVTGRSSRGRVRAVIDSGASLSYVPADVVQGLTPIGKRSDFYPGFGEFETDVWRVRAEIGGRRLTISAGILPPMLQVMFGMILGADGWIVGSDFFRNRVMVIDYPNSRIVDVTEG